MLKAFEKSTKAVTLWRNKGICRNSLSTIFLKVCNFQKGLIKAVSNFLQIPKGSTLP